MTEGQYLTNISSNFSVLMDELSSHVNLVHKDKFEHISSGANDDEIVQTVFSRQRKEYKEILEKEGISAFIDHSILKPETTKDIITNWCNEAKKFKFPYVYVNGSRAEQAVKELAGTKIIVGSVVGFPLGSATSASKVAEAEDLLKIGCKEIDMVMNVGRLKDGDYAYVLSDVEQVVRTAAKYGSIVKVIFECCLLTNDEIIKSCILCTEAGAKFVKTSTGFSTHGAKVEHVWLMKLIVGPSASVKASAGIKDKETALKMLEHGASRIGTSYGMDIIEK